MEYQSCVLKSCAYIFALVATSTFAELKWCWIMFYSLSCTTAMRFDAFFTEKQSWVKVHMELYGVLPITSLVL